MLKQPLSNNQEIIINTLFTNYNHITMMTTDLVPINDLFLELFEFLLILLGELPIRVELGSQLVPVIILVVD